MSIVIEKGIPIPRSLSQALREMQVGDSFVIAEKSNLHTLSKRVGINIVTRKQPDGTFRVWRKEDA